MSIPSLITVFFLLLLVSRPLSFSATHNGSVYDAFTQFFYDLTQSPQSQISDSVFSQTNPSYSSVLRAYIRNARSKTSSSPKPTIILTPRSKSHVAAAVVCSKTLGFLLKIRGSDHGYEGISYISSQPFFIMDMSNLRDVTVDIADESAWVAAGATLGESYYRIWEKSKVHGFSAGFLLDFKVARSTSERHLSLMLLELYSV